MCAQQHQCRTASTTISTIIHMAEFSIEPLNYTCPKSLKQPSHNAKPNLSTLPQISNIHWMKFKHAPH